MPIESSNGSYARKITISDTEPASRRGWQSATTAGRNAMLELFVFVALALKSVMWGT
jgi:hypothetical protein